MSDPPLTDLGRHQARQLARAIVSGAQPRPDVLYSSLMSRAVQTAAIIADACDMPIQGHLEAYECGGPYHGSPSDPTPFPGASADELLAITDRLVLPEGVDETGWYRGHGETVHDRVARARRVIGHLRETYLGQEITVGLVCHEMVSQYFLRAALDLLPDDGVPEPWFSLNNTGTIYMDMEQPVPVTETVHSGSAVERVVEWTNNCIHLDPADISG